MPRTRKVHHWVKSAEAKRYHVKKKIETPEEKAVRLNKAREYTKRKMQNETVFEREKRLARARWMRQKDVAKKRAQEKRALAAEKASQRLQEIQQKGRQNRTAATERYSNRMQDIQQEKRQTQRENRLKEIQRLNHLLQTEVPFETCISRQINDQVHKVYEKVIRLSVSSVRHVSVAPHDFESNMDMDSVWGVHPLYSCPMEERSNGQSESQFEPNVSTSELDYPNPAQMVQVKIEPMISESDDEPSIVLNDRSSHSNYGFINRESMMNSGSMVCEPNNGEEVTDGTRLNPQPMISEPDAGSKASGINSEESALALVKKEVTVKSEVYTEEL